MNNVKKILSAVLLSSLLVGCNQEQTSIEKEYIIKENGYLVLKDEDKERSTVITKVSEIIDNGYMVQNIFDENDKIFLEPYDTNTIKLKLGDNLEVTFNGDIVEDVKKIDMSKKEYVLK